MQSSTRPVLFVVQGRAILVDGTHGTNKYKFCLTTVMVIDDHNRAIPVAFFIHSRQSEDVLTNFFNLLADELGGDFRPSVAIVDDAIAEINALQNSKWCVASRHLSSFSIACF